MTEFADQLSLVGLVLPSEAPTSGRRHAKAVTVAPLSANEHGYSFLCNGERNRELPLRWESR